MQLNDSERKENLQQEADPSSGWRLEVYGWIQSLVVALVIFVLLFTMVFRVVGVDGSSMYPTLENGERLLASNLFYTPRNGDIIIFTVKGLRFSGYPDRDQALVKRVIATEGQVVDIDFTTGEVYVDGELLEETYIAEPTLSAGTMAFPLTVGEGQLFVMGDNRNHSTDSRSSSIGLVDERYVLGHVLLRIFPFDKIGIVD